MHGLSILLYLSCAWLAVAHAEAETEAFLRQPVPEAARLHEAEKEIRNLFKDEFTRFDRQAQLKLAEHLLKKGLESAEDKVLQYQLFALALELAGKNGAVPLARRAADALAHNFQTDRTALKLKAYAACLRLATSKAQVLDLGYAYLQLADEALSQEDFTSALDACNRAESLARTAQSPALLTTATKKTDESRVQRAAFESTRHLRVRLFENPDDPAANLGLGRYFCLVRHDWTRGLPLLARAGEAKWAEAAQADLTEPADGQEQAAIGDNWFDLAQSLPRADQLAVKRRAALWYQRALKQLTGLARLRTEKRLEELRR